MPETVPTLRFIDPPGGVSVLVGGTLVLYSVRFEATDIFGGTTIDLFYTADETVCGASGDPCARHGDCQEGELCRYDTTIGSDAVHPIGQIQKERPGTLSMSVDWNLKGIQDGRYVVFAKLTPGEGMDGTELSFTRPRAGPKNIGDGMLAFGTCGSDETACNIDDDCTSGDVCVIPPDAVDITGDKARLETWTAVCIDPQTEEWRVNGTLTQPVFDYNDPNQDPYELAFTSVPYTSIGGEVTFTITSGSVPFVLGDRFLFSTTGITDVSHAVTIRDGQIGEEPIAIIHAAPLAGFAPLTVTFDGRDSYDPNDEALEYSWDFGDGSPQATGAVVFHTYVDPGAFTAVLMVTNTSSLFGEAAVDIEVINHAPIAMVTATPTSGPAPLEVQFSGAESSDLETPADQLIYQWNFGDGTTANDALVPGTEFQTVAHLYEQTADGTLCTSATPCTFAAALTVLDEAGAEDTDTVHILVGNTNPQPAIIHTALQGPDPWRVVYNAINSWDPDGDTLTVEWVWGDGTPNETHPVTGAGSATDGSVPHTYRLPEGAPSVAYATMALIRDDRGGLATWGPVLVVVAEPESGACCFLVGACFENTAPDDCAAVGGWHQGNGSTCNQGCRFQGDGDFDGDDDVDLDDFAYWSICVTGPAGGPCAEGCQALDLDGDTDLDIADFAGFQLAFTDSQP
jgi:PKD repeat protein